MSTEYWWSGTDRVKLSARGKTYPNANICITNPTRSALRLSEVLHVARPTETWYGLEGIQMIPMAQNKVLFGGYDRSHFGPI